MATSTASSTSWKVCCIKQKWSAIFIFVDTETETDTQNLYIEIIHKHTNITLLDGRKNNETMTKKQRLPPVNVAKPSCNKRNHVSYKMRN